MPDASAVPPDPAPAEGFPIDLGALRRAPVATDPFAHVVAPFFVPPASLPRVAAALPAMSSGGSFPPASLRLGTAARALVEALEGDAMREAVARKFGLDLSGSRTMLTVRGRTRPKDGRIHRDSAAKLVTILLYLNPDEAAWSDRDGCLRLLRGPDDLEDHAVEVAPVRGTLLAFPNGPDTWHGHRTFVGRRLAMQLNYMADSAKARSELRRHRVSAVFKRLTSFERPAARA